MQVLPIIPLYPNPSFTTYNVSLGLPGPKLYDIPVAGKYAEKNDFPNTKSSILFPDVDYIKKFANYELGIADGILNAAQGFNVAKIGEDEQLKGKFNDNFNFASQDGMGLKSLEKTIISSIFESQKPYFKIAQFAIENLISIEDILARTAPLLGAAINPFMALAIKSRKPIGNGPSEDNPLSLTQFGSPPAIGYKGGEEIRGNVNDFRTISQSGLEIDGEGSVTAPPHKPILNLGDFEYDYVTVSVAYSTGTFKTNVEYNIEYIDLFDEDPPLPIVDIPEEEADNLPDSIVLGIFDSNGTPINPNERLKHYGLDGNNQLQITDSIFSKATWITEPDKWILKKAVNETFYWKTLDNVQYHWKRGSEIKIQNEEPNGQWKKLKYKDILDFNNEKNQNLKYREDEFIVTFPQPEMDEYIRYYESIVDKELKNREIENEQRPDIKKEVSEIYNEDQLKRTSEDLFIFAQMKSTFYNGIDEKDWSKYNDSPSPLETFPEELRKVFKPMLFRLEGQEVWIDPEIDYDYKVIRVDSTNKIKYTSGDIVKNSNIETFIKNTLEIEVISESQNIPFNITIDGETQNNVSTFQFNNWNIDANFNVDNTIDFNLKIWLDDDTILYENNVNEETTINDINLLPSLFRKNKLVFNGTTINIETSTINKFKAQINENGIIKSVNVSDIKDDVKKDGLYSSGKYGPGWGPGEIKDKNGNVVGTEGGNPQKVGYVRRPKLTELDNETYFIIEGVRKTRNTTLGGGNEGDEDDGNGFYRMPDALGIIPVVIKMAIGLFSEFFPAISNLISLISNPMKFLTDIITFKIADPRTGFNVFSAQSLGIISQLGAVIGNTTAMKSIVSGSQLANYVFVNPTNGDYKFLLDGPAVIDFFGLVFGIDVAFSDKIPIKPIFGAIPRSENLTEFLNEKNPEVTNTSDFADNNGTIKTKESEKDVFKNTDTIPNSIKTQVGRLTSYEEIYITYPEGKKEGIEYDYIYINEEINLLIQEANDLKETDDINKLREAKGKLELAIQKERDKGVIKDANGRIVNFDESKVNQPLIKVLTDQISQLTQAVGIADQPIFKMILGVVSTPLKVVLGIIKELMEIFKKFLNPLTLADALANFLSFQWIMKFFDPMKLLSLAGITFNPLKAAEWCLAVNTPNPLFGVIPGASKYLVPDEFPIADLSQFLNTTFTATLPTYTAKQYRDMCLKPFRLFSPFICFIEQLINSFIMLVWAVMGITAIIPPPFIKICQKLNENIDPEDMMDILNGLYIDNNAALDDRGGDTYDFIYEVELPDGTQRTLNNEELQDFIDDNSNIYYDFTNFSTIE